MRLRFHHIIFILTVLIVNSCSDEPCLNDTTQTGRIGFSTSDEWRNPETDSTRSGRGARRKMIGVAAMSGQLPEKQDSLFLQIIEDDMMPEEESSDNTRSVLRSGYYYTQISLSAYRYLNGTWDETQTPDFFNNIPLQLQQGSGYTEYTWPGAKYSLRFFGTAPTGEGTLSAPDKAGYPTLDYTVPADISKQRSLITVFTDEYSGDYRKYVDLKFHHVTSSVYFREADGLIPGTIKSISLRNIYGSGTYDFKTDSWSGLRNLTSYTSELDKRVTGMDGKEITDYLTAFTVLPQQTPEDTLLEVVYTDDYTKEERVLTGSLSCRFEAGKRYDIYISPQSIRCEYSLEIDKKNIPEEGKDASPVFLDMSFHKNDNTEYHNILSIKLRRKIMRADMEDEFEYIDPINDCNIEYYKFNTTSGKYDIPTKRNDTFLTYLSYTDWTVIGLDSPTMTFYVKKPPVATGAIDRALKEMPERGSDQKPYNLANATGEETVENTANCYIVNAPGTYSIPLVYGNAIKDGKTNEQALVNNNLNTVSGVLAKPKAARVTSRTKSALSATEFDITSPYLADFTPTTTTPENYIRSAKVQWQSPAEDLISDVKLSDDRRTLTFKVNRSTIRQGNALISAFYGNYELWSWHIWITNIEPYKTDKVLVNREGKKYTVMPSYLGWVDQREGNDEYVYRMVINVKGTKRRFEFFPRIQAELKMFGETALYQWGRPMPFMNPVTSEISYSTFNSLPNRCYALSVCSPMIVFTNVQNRTYGAFLNAWNFNLNSIITATTQYKEPTSAKTWNSEQPIKSVYDPCPAGYCIPTGDTFTGLFSHTGSTAYFNNDYRIAESKYSNAVEIYCNPFARNPEDTYVFPSVDRCVYNSSFTIDKDFALWTSSVEQYRSGAQCYAFGHAFLYEMGYTPCATPTEYLNQIIPMREP